MIAAYGVRAAEFARSLGDIDAIVAEVPHHVDAILEAIRWRAQGRAFYGMIMYDDPRQTAILNIAGQVLPQLPTYDLRRNALSQLAAGVIAVNGKPVSQMWATDPAAQQSVTEFLSISPLMLARSYTELARLCAFAARQRPFEIAVHEPLVPVVQRDPAQRPAVIVWAPPREAGFLAWHAFALTEFRGDVTCVCAGGSIPQGVSASFVSANDPSVPALLAAAQVIVCPEIHDPGPAIAFARQGYGIVAPVTSGVHEYVRDVATYGDANLNDIPIAVSIALTRPASIRAIPPPPPPATARAHALPVRIDERPLVTVIVLTYNRPDDLARALACLREQTYAPLEVVVVNDCGENVDHVVAAFPFARVLNLAVNGGAFRASNLGFAEARGEYIQVLADDDVLYPDHIERLMAAMLGSGAAFAHGNTIIHYQRVEPNGSLVTTGYNASTFNDSTTPTLALVATPIAGHSFMVRRDLWTELGGYREDCALADQEFQLRAAARYAFAYVDHMTAEWRMRTKGNFSTQTDSYGALRALYEQLHPVPDRPVVERQRQQALENVRNRPPGTTFPATILVGVPLPR